MPSEPSPKPRRFASALALGVRLSGAGLLQKVSIGIVILTVLGAIAVAIDLLHGESPPLAAIPGLTADALAWGGGFTFAVAAAAHMFDKDAIAGVRTLARTRGVSDSTYVVGRVLGLAVTLMLLVGIGALVTGGVCAALAPGSRAIVLRATLATLPYAVAYGIVIAPLAAATLGSRSRSRGYLVLLAVLILPELAQDSLDNIPEHWRSLVGLPSAMATLRDSLVPAHFDGALAAAAVGVIAIVSALCLLLSFEAASSSTRAEISA